MRFECFVTLWIIEGALFCNGIEIWLLLHLDVIFFVRTEAGKIFWYYKAASSAELFYLSCVVNTEKRVLIFYRPMRPVFISRKRCLYALSLLLVLSSPREVFLPVLRFSSLLKNQHLHVPIRPGMVDEESHCGCATTRSLFIYLFIYLFKCH